jgi:hypothetical protein
MISIMVKRFKKFYEAKKAESLLPRAIITAPTEVNKEVILPGENFFFHYADDEKIILNRNEGKFVLLFIGLLMPLGVFGIYNLFETEDCGDKIMFGISGIPFFIVGLCSIIYAITEPKKNIIFNRKDQTVTFPGTLWGKPKIFLFKDMEAGINYTSVRFMPTGTYLSGGKSGKPDEPMVWFRDISIGLSEEKDWSFYVWYMDKNRPLPPGTAFDEFRERDDLRRKKEGNPPPLYPSYLD